MVSPCISIRGLLKNHISNIQTIYFMETTTKHFKGKIRQGNKNNGFIVSDDGDTVITPEILPANAAHIVKCWNTHDSLVSVLTEIEAQYRKVWLKSPVDYDVLDKAKQLLNQLNTKP